MLRPTLFAFFFASAAAFASVSVFTGSEGAALAAARKIADVILEKKEKGAVLGLATGSTMIPVYAELKKIILEEEIDLSNVVTFNLDEYLDLPASHPQSFRSFMFSHLFGDLLYSPENPRGIRLENIHFPSGENPAEYDALIQRLGPIDLQLLGIGRNGHIGFAEPGTPLNSQTRIVDLKETTRQDNAHFFEGDLRKVPTRAVTMGIETILKAQEILLLAFGEMKAEAIEKTVQGPVSSDVPSSALKLHPKTSFYLDETAASLLKDSRVQKFTNARILLDREIVEGELWVSQGKIIAPQKKADVEIDVEGNILAPGFIDLQINGAFGCDFSRDPEKIGEVAHKLLQYGVTGFLSTLVSSSSKQYHRLIPLLQPRSFGKEGAALLGIHLEGPFFSPSFAGAHNKEHLLSPSENPLETVYGTLRGVKLVTLAPELPGALPLIKLLQEQKIAVSVGHSAANSGEMRAAIDAGLNLATHLFNAMPSYHHRNPGIIGAALLSPGIPYTIIADGVHVCPESLLLASRCNPEGLILISDAAEALGMTDGCYKLGTLDIEVRSNQIYLAGTQTLAGSCLPLDKAVRNLRSMTGCSTAEALEAASLKPAQLLGLYPAKGTLAVGADADFLILSDDLIVQAAYVGGAKAYAKK